jgi:hypothetical protein
MLEKLYLELTKKNNRFKQRLLSLVNEFIDEFETEEGRIKRDFKKLSEFQSRMDAFFDEHGVAFMAWMVMAIDKLLKQAAKNFEQDGATYEDVAFMRELLGAKGTAVATKRNGQPTVLYSLFTLGVIKLDIVNKIQGAMLGDSRMKDFRPAMQRAVSRRFNDFFEVNTVAVLFNTYNAANRFFAKEYKYKKFRYEGGLIADSRDFCVERDGLEFWIEDGESWNDLDWKGKIPGVDFFVQVGGYNCKHWLVYIKE